MSLSKRIAKVCDVEKSQAEFSRKTGIDRGVINKVIREDRGMTTSSIELVLIAYPTLNARWLLTGEGEMWNEGSSKEVAELEEENARLKEENARYKAEIDRIYNNIDDVRKLNKVFEEEIERLKKEKGYYD